MHGNIVIIFIVRIVWNAIKTHDINEVLPLPLRNIMISYHNLYTYSCLNSFHCIAITRLPTNWVHIQPSRGVSESKHRPVSNSMTTPFDVKDGWHVTRQTPDKHLLLIQSIAIQASDTFRILSPAGLPILLTMFNSARSVSVSGAYTVALRR